MTIDWQHFTPWSSLSGGLLIGVAAALLILLQGRILGVSGIVGRLMPPRSGDAGWRIAFILGILAAPSLYRLFVAGTPSITTGWGGLIVAGLLVGFGTRLGSGCTSGHSICGLSRLSPRSLVATVCFMLAGFLTVFVLRHWIGWNA